MWRSSKLTRRRGAFGSAREASPRPRKLTKFANTQSGRMLRRRTRLGLWPTNSETRSASVSAFGSVTAFLAFVYGAVCDRLGAMAELADLQQRSRGGKVLPFNMALVHLGLGEHAKTIDDLEAALAADSQMMAWIGRDPLFDSIRSEPRFVALLKKIGLNR